MISIFIAKYSIKPNEKVTAICSTLSSLTVGFETANTAVAYCTRTSRALVEAVVLAFSIHPEIGDGTPCWLLIEALLQRGKGFCRIRSPR